MERSTQVKVFYDGACPICQREIGYYQTCRGAEAIDWVDVSGADALRLPASLDQETALARFHVQTETGKVLDGAAAFVALWGRLERFRLLEKLLNNRPTLWLLNQVYALLLKVRPALQRLF